jgi:hypothetical protein
LDAFVPNNTLSSDKLYGVTVPPSENAANAWTKTNDLVEMKSKRVLGCINTDTAYASMNHSELLPAWWSADDTSLLWQVNGKWGIDEQMLVRLKGGEIEWELDIVKVLQRDILTRTETANPKGFLAAKKRNWDDGSAFPEKFSFDSEADNANKGPLTFPVHFRIYLTANPKGADDVPEVDSSMEATLDQNGEIKITGFRLGKNRSAPWYSIQTESR